MTLMKDPQCSWVREADTHEDQTAAEITITAAELAKMHPSNRTADPWVGELTGPPQAYVDLPLDWFSDMQGQIQPAEFPGAIRIIQRVNYQSFCLVGDTAEDVQARALLVHSSVTAELKAHHETSYIWWRLHPKYELQPELPPAKSGCKAVKPARHRVRMRLGTMPALPYQFWLDLYKRVANVSSEPLVPRG